MGKDEVLFMLFDYSDWNKIFRSFYKLKNNFSNMEIAKWSEYLKQFYRSPPLHFVIARNDNAELCRMSGSDMEKDPSYWLATKDRRLVKFGETGLVKSIQRGEEVVIDRANAYGNFQVKQPYSLKTELDSAYEIVSSLDFNGYKEVFNWRAQRVIDRFGDYRELYDGADIIPEYNDTMSIIKISERCPRGCIYCSEPSPKGMKLYSREKIEQNIDSARRLQLKYHKGHTSLMNEGFINCSDILWFHLAKAYVTGNLRTHKLDNLIRRLSIVDVEGNVTPIGDISSKYWDTILDSVQIQDMFKSQFPELRKTGTFVGAPTVNATDYRFLEELYNKAQRINRVLIGIESFDNTESAFLGKNETSSEKIDAIQKLQGIDYKVKVIIQVGMLGKRFYYDGKWIDTEKGLEKTLRILAQVMRKSYDLRKPDKVHVSRYTLIEGTPLKRLHDEGKVIEPFAPGELDERVDRAFRQLRKSHIDVDADYEAAVEKRKRMV